MAGWQADCAKDGYGVMGLQYGLGVSNQERRDRPFTSRCPTPMHDTKSKRLFLRLIPERPHDQSATQHSGSSAFAEGLTNMLHHRSSSRIPGDRASLAHRVQPDSGSVPHAHLCAEHSGRKVPLLVLLARPEEGQEGHW